MREPEALAELGDARRVGLHGDLGKELRSLLSSVEVNATLARTERLLRDRTFPVPRRDWPAIPFPPF